MICVCMYTLQLFFDCVCLSLAILYEILIATLVIHILHFVFLLTNLTLEKVWLVIELPLLIWIKIANV